MAVLTICVQFLIPQVQKQNQIAGEVGKIIGISIHSQLILLSMPQEEMYSMMGATIRAERDIFPLLQQNPELETMLFVGM